MKRLFLALAMIVGISAVAICQNVNVNVNGSNNYSDGYKYINGICSCEDIGGVELYLTNQDGCCNYKAYFGNYNGFRVTVVFEFVLYMVFNGEGEYVTKVGSIVIEPNSTKDVSITRLEYGYFVKSADLTGLIVRKLAE